MNCYRVTVECTNSSKNFFTVSDEGNYYNCLDGELYVVAETMSEVEEFFSKTPNIMRIEKIGVGYYPMLYPKKT